MGITRVLLFPTNIVRFPLIMAVSLIGQKVFVCTLVACKFKALLRMYSAGLLILTWQRSEKNTGCFVSIFLFVLSCLTSISYWTETMKCIYRNSRWICIASPFYFNTGLHTYSLHCCLNNLIVDKRITKNLLIGKLLQHSTWNSI